MSTAKVTIAIPTFNRAELLKACLRSALAQDYEDFLVIVIDNASTDHTEAVVGSFSDRRLRYVRNEKNVGLFRNFNRAVALNASPYFCLLEDDDLLLPGFLSESVAALEQYPGASFSIAEERLVDVDGAPFAGASRDIADPNYLASIANMLRPDRPPAGIMDGLDYLHGTVEGRNWVVYLSATLFRFECVKNVGAFDHPHCKDALDINLFCRLAAHSDIVVIRKLLAEIRLHAGSQTHTHFDSARSLFALALFSERMDALGTLMKSKRAAEPDYRRWLGDQLQRLTFQQSQELRERVPSLNYSWNEMLDCVRDEIEACVPAGERFVLVDDNAWNLELADGRLAVPFLERDGQYWGAPPDDGAAIDALEQERRKGAKFIVFGWPAFWWLDYYGELRDHLTSHYDRVARNSRMVVYDLRDRNTSREPSA